MQAKQLLHKNQHFYWVTFKTPLRITYNYTDLKTADLQNHKNSYYLIWIVTSSLFLH